MEQRYLSAQDVANYIGTTKDGVRSFYNRHADFPRGCKVGRLRRWKRDEIDTWIANLNKED